jgi:hypothetical protein
MLRELRARSSLRWFADDDMELFVWFVDGRPAGFQLCYDRLTPLERAITWREREGYHHDYVAAGDDSPVRNRTPTMQARPSDFDGDPVARAFEEASAAVDVAVRTFVLEKLRAYPARVTPKLTLAAVS